jgi:TatA/E family protein of Tat protein translocase
MRIMDMAIIAVIVLALFGAKTLQSVAHSAGKTAAQMKQAKKQVMSDLGVDDLKKATEALPRIPLNPQQAVKQYILSDTSKKAPAEEASTSSSPAAKSMKPAIEG